MTPYNSSVGNPKHGCGVGYNEHAGCVYPQGVDLASGWLQVWTAGGWCREKKIASR